jgi:hypothetical protein
VKSVSVCRFNGLPRLLALTLLAATVTAAQAQESIGIAVTIRNEVNGTVASRTFRINAGEDVFRQEVVSTGPDSTAKLVFADSTNLAIGPDSAVTLDKFVYAGATDYKKATMRLVKGLFRFTTGNSDKRAYEIKTDVATIGVRGTVVDINSETGRTIVVLQQGSVLACSTSNRCTVLSLPGETAVITAASATNEGVGGGGGWSFAGSCASDASLCEKTNLASSQPSVTTPNYRITTRSSRQPEVTPATSSRAVTAISPGGGEVVGNEYGVVGNENVIVGVIGLIGVNGAVLAQVANTIAQNPSNPASP